MHSAIHQGFMFLVLAVVGLSGCGNSALPMGTSQGSGGTTGSGGSSVSSTGGGYSNLAGGATAIGNAGASSTGAAVCDPLAPPPITLGTILGVGQDAQGTLYVADQTPDYVTRVFVVTGGVLVRKYVTGSGQRGGQSDTDYTLSFQDSAPSTSTIPPALLIQIRGGSTTAMAIDPNSSRIFIGDPSAAYTLLTLVDPSTIAGLPLQNLPNTIAYVEDVNDGNVIVITMPVDYTSASPFRHKVYYGSTDAVIERTITSDTQGLDISSGPVISFVVDSATYTFSYYYPYPPDSGVRSGGISVSDGRTLTCNDRDVTAASLSGLTFVCSTP